MSDKEKKKLTKKEEQQRILDTYNNAAEEFARKLYKNVGSVLNANSRYNYLYTPWYSNEIIKDINVNPKAPQIQDVISWLKNPAENEKNIRDLSQYLYYAEMHYKRAVEELASMFTFNYDFTPDRSTLPNPNDANAIKQFGKSLDKALSWLQKFRIKKQFRQVMTGVIMEDAKFYYVREKGNYIDLQEMPSDYCIITAPTSVGYAYSFDMLWFARFGYIKTGFPSEYFAPEFNDWFEDFLLEYKKGTLIHYYQPMPPERSVTFKWDSTRVAIVSPMAGVMKDALDIDTYKDLLKLQTQLDTWMLLYMQIPLDNEKKPAMDLDLATQFAGLAKSQLPQGVEPLATPLEPKTFKFDRAQNKDNIVGTGSSLFYNTSGQNPIVFGNDKATSAGAILYSLLVDYGFIDQMLSQFEDFVNFQLNQISGKHKFYIKFKRTDTIYNNDANRKDAVNAGTFGVLKPQQVMSYYGVEPFDIEGNDFMAKYWKMDTDMVTLPSAHTRNGNDEGGREKKDVKTVAEGTEISQQYDTNANKV